MSNAHIIGLFIHDLDQLLEKGSIDRLQHQRIELRLLALQKMVDSD